MLRLAYYADDFTGATDALESLTLAGLRTALFTTVPTAAALAAYGPLDAIGFAGATRSLAPKAMAAELRPAFAAIRALGVPHVHYKVCSTFDSSPAVGSIGRAIELGAECFATRFVPVVGGAPALGRYCVFGNLFARMGIGSRGEVHRLDRHPAMSRHPVTPADEADLRLHLTRQTSRRIALLDFLSLDGSEAAARAALDGLLAGDAEVVLCDALTPAHLARIGALLDHGATPTHPLFSVGSSAVGAALGAHWAGQGTCAPRKNWPDPGPVDSLLVLSGSCSPVTAGQISWAEANGFALIPLAAPALLQRDSAAGAAALRAVVAALRSGRPVVLHTSRGEMDPALADWSAAERGRLGTALGELARDILAAAPVRRLLVAGGDTSSYAAKALGLQALEMSAPLAPGAPLCRARAPGSPADGLELVFKGGQVGAPDFFGAVILGHL